MSIYYPAMVSWVVCLLLGSVMGHGRLRNPPGRSTMWRYDFETPQNVNDHETNCGGFGRQWHQNAGLCGICGDAYDMPPPRANEMGGTYGLGIITKTYMENQVIDIEIELTAYHQGFFEFRLCPLNTKTRPASQTCLDRHVLRRDTGGGKFYPTPPSQGGRYWLKYQLPQGLTCSQCVLQWRYFAGNSWGRCENGTEGIGCGAQEEFRACSDIAIHDNSGWFDTTPNTDVDTDGKVSTYDESHNTPTSEPASADRCSAALITLIISLAAFIRGSS